MSEKTKKIAQDLAVRLDAKWRVCGDNKEFYEDLVKEVEDSLDAYGTKAVEDWAEEGRRILTFWGNQII